MSVADILVVDDNASNLLAIEAALAELGGCVHSAQSGSEALRLLLEHDFALILLDVKMPAMDGLETARLIRARKRSSHTPIIFMTAYGRDDNEVYAAYALGAVDFLFKPMLPELLRAKATVFVELQARTKEVARQAEEIREHQKREHERSLREERQRWEAESLRREMQQLAEADQQKDRFLSLLSHELRTPLASITTGLELLRLKLGDKPGSVDGSVLHTRDVMARQAYHLTRMVDDLLDLARIASGKVGLSKELVPLAQVVEDALRATRPLFVQNEHELRTDLPSGKVDLYGDAVRLVQVLVNLLNNAARYTPARGLITVRAVREGSWVEIHVIDNGRGLHPDKLSHVFEEFWQETSQPGGLGLGLSVVRQLVTLHGGTVAAKSAGPGKGSCFTVRLPLMAMASVPPPPLPGLVDDLESQPRGSARAGMRPLSIVVIDDSEDVRELMADLLRTWGHTVEVAPDGEAGSELTVRQKPDVAFVDIGLPKLDGYGVAAYVREHMPANLPRLVAMTGFGQESDRRRALAAGFDIHIVKPASMDALRSALSFEDSSP